MRQTWKWIGFGATSILLVLLVVGFVWSEDLSKLAKKDIDTSIKVVEVNQYYKGNILVDVDKKRLIGSLQVSAINKTDVAHNAIFFHLYPNAFKDKDKLRDENWDYILGSNHSPGWIDIHRVLVNGRENQFKVTDTILEVPLDTWAGNNQVIVELDFELQLPKNNGRLSYDEHSIWLGNWLPIMAEYGENGWYLDPYYPIGDPFYSDVSNYELEIDLPVGYQIASSGIEAEQKIQVYGNRQKHKISARQVRDFALVIMDNNYHVISDQINGVKINTWFRNSDKSSLAKKLHKAGQVSIEYFSKAYGDYPYKEYDIVHTGGFFGGMEYPGLVFIQGAYFEQNNDYGVVVVAHETAHQWWYGLVGNNEVDSPWMDESLTEYSTLRFLLDHYNRIGKGILSAKERSLTLSKQFEGNQEYVGNSVKDFSNWDSYGMLVYYKGSMMFYLLEKAIGLERMNQVLSDYFNEYQYHNVSDQELINVFEKHLGEQVRTYFESWLEGGKATFIQ